MAYPLVILQLQIEGTCSYCGGDGERAETIQQGLVLEIQIVALVPIVVFMETQVVKHVVHQWLVYLALVWHVVPLGEHVLVMVVYVFTPKVVVAVELYKWLVPLELGLVFLSYIVSY